MTAVLAALTELAAAVAERDDVAAVEAWRSVPVGERGLLAALVLAAANRDVNQKQVSDVGRFSRSQFTPSDKPSRRLVAQHLGLAVDIAGPAASFLLGAARPTRTLAEAEAEIRRRDQIIHDLRQSVAMADADRQLLAEYARSVHEQLYPQVLENIKTREERVIDARPRLVALSDLDDDQENSDDD